MSPNVQLPEMSCSQQTSSLFLWSSPPTLRYNEHWGWEYWPWAMQGLLSTSNILLTKAGKFILTNLGKTFFPHNKGWTKTHFPLPTQKTHNCKAIRRLPSLRISPSVNWGFAVHCEMSDRWGSRDFQTPFEMLPGQGRYRCWLKWHDRQLFWRRCRLRHITHERQNWLEYR